MTKMIIGMTGLFVILSISTSVSAQCQTDNDCRGGRVCINTKCSYPTCSKDTDCPPDQICESGTCQMMNSAAATTATTTSTAAPSGQPLQVRYETRKTNIPALWITGLVVTSVVYLATVGVTAGVSSEPNKGEAIGYAAIPVLGPFVMLASDLDTSDYAAPLVISGILQMGGAAMFIMGLTMTRTVQVPVVALGNEPTAPKLAVIPMTTGIDGLGMKLSLSHF